MNTALQYDEPVDLGAALIETRGILVIGKPDVEDDGAFLNGGIHADD